MRHAVKLRGYENELLSQITQAQILVLPLLSSVILDKVLQCSFLGFPICELGIITVPTSQHHGGLQKMMDIRCNAHTGTQRVIARGQLLLAISSPQAKKNNAEGLMKMHTEVLYQQNLQLQWLLIFKYRFLKSIKTNFSSKFI